MQALHGPVCLFGVASLVGSEDLGQFRALVHLQEYGEEVLLHCDVVFVQPGLSQRQEVRVFCGSEPPYNFLLFPCQQMFDLLLQISEVLPHQSLLLLPKLLFWAVLSVQEVAVER